MASFDRDPWGIILSFLPGEFIYLAYYYNFQQLVLFSLNFKGGGIISLESWNKILAELWQDLNSVLEKLTS